MKKVVLFLGVVVGLTSCEPTITSNNVSPQPVTYSKAQTIKKLNYWIRYGNDNVTGWVGDTRFNYDFPFGTHTGEDYLFISLLDSNQYGYTYQVEIRDYVGVSANPVHTYQQQQPVFISTSGTTNTESIKFSWNVDEGDYYRVTECVLSIQEEDEDRFDVKLEQEYIKKNGPNEVGTQLKQCYYFTSYRMW